VPTRIILVAAAATVLAGCANDIGVHPLSIHSGIAGAAKASMLGGPDQASVQEAELKRAAQQKTLSAKMLAAIALERVTGRTPDPARFNDLR
jgi:hypothetical protein